MGIMPDGRDLALSIIDIVWYEEDLLWIKKKVKFGSAPQIIHA